MVQKIISKKAKRIVRWHSSYVIFLTKEIKELGWEKNSHVKISLIDEGKEKKILIEKLEL